MRESDLVIDTRLGDYRIVRLLGQGGMGQVFEARHETLGRRVALKVLTRHKNPELVKRLEREARASAQMHHPNIVQVTELHVPAQPSAEDPAYLIMEFVDGDTLQHRLDTTPRLEPELVRRIGVQMASALAYAHGRGVVHRDVKPDNILLTEVPGVGLVAKLLDFGIARILEETALTQEGTLVGTPRYMSPEQALGRPVGPSSDLFGLGATLYVALFGRAPFPGRTLTELSMQLASPAPAEAPVDLPGADTTLVGTILRCLGKLPEARPDSAADLQRELELQERDTQPLPLSAPPPAPRDEVTATFPAPRRTLVIGLGIAAIAVATAAAVTLGTQRPAAQPAPALVQSAPTAPLDPPQPGATPIDLVLGNDRPCALLSSGEVFCWPLTGTTSDAIRVPNLGHVDEISFENDRTWLRAGQERFSFLGGTIVVEPGHRDRFEHAPLSLGDTDPLATTCPSDVHGCFVWSRAGMRWVDEDRGTVHAIPPAPACQTTPVDVAYPAGPDWLWLLRCGTVTYFLAHDALHDRLPPEDLFYTRAIFGLPAHAQLLGAGDGTLKVKLEGGKSWSYHPKLVAPAGDPAWKAATPIDAGYRIPFGPTERVAKALRPPPCALAADGIVCAAGELTPTLAERGRALGASFGATPLKRVWSNPQGAVCALGDDAGAWTLRCIGHDETSAPRAVRF